jgi:toxin ParE1/3/4
VKLDVTKGAIGDLDDILMFSVKNWGVDQGFEYVQSISDAMRDMLGQKNPGQSAADISHGLRRKLVGSHAIWFRLAPDRLVVLRILHQSRDAGRWMG